MKGQSVSFSTGRSLGNPGVTLGLRNFGGNGFSDQNGNCDLKYYLKKNKTKQIQVYISIWL